MAQILAFLPSIINMYLLDLPSLLTKRARLIQAKEGLKINTTDVSFADQSFP